MKNLKFSFAAVIAVVALGFTIAAQAGAFETKAALVADCFRPTVELKTACADELDEVIVGEACNLVAVGDHIWSLSGTQIDPASPTNGCNSGSFICCFRIALETAPCADQPQIDPAGTPVLAQYKVSQVFCKNTAN